MPLFGYNYEPGDQVEVRSGAPAWWPGVVSFVNDEKIEVDISRPWPTADEWSGVVRRYGGDSPVKQVTIWIASEVISGGEGRASHIRPTPLNHADYTLDENELIVIEPETEAEQEGVETSG